MSEDQRRLLALSARALRLADCEHAAVFYDPACYARPSYPHTRWCLRCKLVKKLEQAGYREAERPSDRDFREALERGEVYEVYEGKPS
jgi:hypothetical protein